MIFPDYGEKSKSEELVYDGGYANSIRKDDFTSYVPS